MASTSRSLAPSPTRDVAFDRGRRAGDARATRARAHRRRRPRASSATEIGADVIAVAASPAPSGRGASPSPPDGYGFSAAGMIFPYHVGAWRVLSETNLIGPTTPVAGASAGALVAAFIACGMTPDDGERALMRVLRDCRANGVLGRVGAVLEATLREELPRDAHERCSRGNLHVSITTPKLLGPWNAGTPDENRVGFNGGPVALDGELVSAFDTFDDLVGALLSSCHIPLYCGWPTRAYRGKRRVDGGWTNLAPTPPGSLNATRVASFPLLDAWNATVEGDGAATGNFFAKEASFWAGWGDDESRGSLIAPDAAGGVSDVDYVTLGKWALLPASDDILDELVEMGRRDAARWVEVNGFCEDRAAAAAVATADAATGS